MAMRRKVDSEGRVVYNNWNFQYFIKYFSEWRATVWYANK